MRRGNWHEAVGEECLAVRSAVGVLDQTSFAKYSVSGPGAEAFLDRLCANRLPAVGRIALTQMCRPGGGIECDVTITRTEPERFHVVSAAATELHDYAWLEWHLPDDGSVELHNDTERYGVLTLAGPRSRELLQSLVEDDISREAFPFFRARHLEVAGLPTLTLRVSYVGELGFELHHPVEHLAQLYERLLGGRRAARAGRLRVPRARVAAAREGLSPVGRGHVRRLDAARGGARAVRGLRQGRLRRP